MDQTQIQLRPFMPDDRERILDILTSSRINQTYMLPDYSQRADAIPLFNRLMKLSKHPQRYVRCVVLEDTAIGFLNDVEMKDGIIELGYAIHPDYHNRGYMTEALQIAIKELLEFGYTCVICGAFEENKASQRVMEKCGMSKISKTDELVYRGQLHHCIYYSIRNEGK